MISYPVYKVIHYLGIFALIAVLASALGRGAGGDPGTDPWRRRFAAWHGVALFVVLLGGFGMLARLDVTTGLTLPGWIWAKLALWAVLGALMAVARRSATWSARALVAVPLLAAAAGLIALTKPF